MSRQKRIRWLVGCIIMLLALVPVATYAHNGGFPRLNGVVSGDYRIYAWTLPNPWVADEDLHISVAITKADAKATVASGPSLEVLVAETTVSAVFTPPVGSAALGFTRLLTATESLGGIYYESDLQLARDGDWRVTILANDTLGESSADFVVTVMPSRQVNWLLIGSGSALFVALLVIAAIWGRRKPAAATTDRLRPTPSPRVGIKSGISSQ